MTHRHEALWRTLLISLMLNAAILCIFAPLYAPVYAHGGGTPRLTHVPVGPYHLYAWSDPEPWRVGQVHLSLAVTKPNPANDTNQIEIPVTDANITVTFTPLDDNIGDNTGVSPGEKTEDTRTPIVTTAVRQEFLSDFYFEADPVLPHEGNWQINIAVEGEEGSGEAEFTLEALPARTLDWTLIASAGGVLILLLALIALWSRAQQPAQPVRHPHPGVRRAQPRGSKVQVRKEA